MLLTGTVTFFGNQFITVQGSFLAYIFLTLAILKWFRLQRSVL